jgi:hypothetical protein
MIENRHYPQEQVDYWSKYYDYKGEQFMESKKQEMNQSIQNDNLQEWIDNALLVIEFIKLAIKLSSTN